VIENGLKYFRFTPQLGQKTYFIIIDALAKQAKKFVPVNFFSP